MNDNHAPAHFLDDLYETIASRKGGNPEISYTAKLFEGGIGKMAGIIGEEATEVIVAALSETPDNVISERADLLYHLLVLWAEQGITPEDVFEELQSRAGKSGVEEKESRDQETDDGL